VNSEPAEIISCGGSRFLRTILVTCDRLGEDGQPSNRLTEVVEHSTFERSTTDQDDVGSRDIAAPNVERRWRTAWDEPRFLESDLISPRHELWEVVLAISVGGYCLLDTIGFARYYDAHASGGDTIPGDVDVNSSGQPADRLLTSHGGVRTQSRKDSKNRHRGKDSVH
jgi:hypothetical protein